MLLCSHVASGQVSIAAGEDDGATTKLRGYVSPVSIHDYLTPMGSIHHGFVKGREVDSVVNYESAADNRFEMWLTLRADVPQDFFSTMSYRLDADTRIVLDSGTADFLKFGAANYTAWSWRGRTPGELLEAGEGYGLDFTYYY